MTEDQNGKEPFEENFFEQMENAPSAAPGKKLHRSRTDVIVLGVCSGIADYLSADVANIRLIAILSILLGGWGLVAYLITGALLPVDQNQIQLADGEKKDQRKENFRVVLSGIIIFVGFHFALVSIGLIISNRLFIFPNSFVLPILFIAIGVYLVFSNRQFEVSNKELPTDYNRTRDNRIIIGVCGGIGKYLNVDPTAVRIIFIIAALLTLGFAAIGYLVIGVSSNLETEKTLEIQ